MCEFNNQETLAGIRQSIMRHLSESCDITQLSRDFANLQSNWARVNFALEILENIKFQAPFISKPKNDKIALKFRESGNQCFKVKKLMEACEFYTQSLSYAPSGGVNLSLAYANRSAVLLEAGFNAECLSDISRALAANYPPNLVQKLLKRREIASKSHSSPRSWHEEIPQIAEKNATIASAAASIEINYSTDLGRHVIAHRDIEPGEVLAVEKAYVSMPVDSGLIISHCHNCLRHCYNLIPCDNCVEALYCSEQCKIDAFQHYHEIECHVLSTLKALQVDKLKMLPLRIALKSRAKDDAHRSSDVYQSDSYREIDKLISNCDKRSVSDLFERALNCAIIMKIITIKRPELVQDMQFKETLMHHMQTAPSNFHEVTELVINNESGVYEPCEIGSGAFSFLSLLNHSCNPNVTRFCYGDTLVLRAIEKITKGEQCYDNYGYHYAVTAKQERQDSLKSQYYFTCNCKACAENWGLYQNLKNVDNDNTDCIEDETVSKLSRGDLNTAEMIIGELLEKLRFYQDFKPCSNFCKIQEMVKQCYAISGNKRITF